MEATTIRVKGLKPRVDVFTKKLHENMSRLWKDATKAFLEEIIKNDLIKVDTGMSRASLLPLARAVRMLTVVRASINPKSKPRQGYNELGGGYNATGVKSIATGEKLGEKAYKLNLGSPARPVFYFEFNIVVYQHWIHEVYNSESDWQAIEKGTQAFKAYLEDNSSSYVPTLSDWIVPE